MTLLTRDTNPSLASRQHRRTEPLAAVVVLTLALASCSSYVRIEPTELIATRSPSPSGAQLPNPMAPACDLSNGWSLTYTVSGGLAGVTETFIVGDSGDASLSSAKPPSQSRGSILGPQIDELKQALETACATGQGSGRSKPCPDCLEYQVVLTTSDKSITWAGSSGDTLSPAIESLFGILDRLAGGLRSP